MSGFSASLLSPVVSLHRCLLYLRRLFTRVNRVHFIPPDHLFLDSAPNLGSLIACWEMNRYKNWWYKSVRILEVLRLLFQEFLYLSSSQRDMSGPRLGALSKNRWSWGIEMVHHPEAWAPKIKVLPLWNQHSFLQPLLTASGHLYETYARFSWLLNAWMYCS